MSAEVIPAKGSRAAAVQLRFDEIERQLPGCRPLAPLKAVMFVLDRTEDNARFLYEAGYLQFAFDLAGPGANRKEVRIYRESVLRYMRGQLDHLKTRNAECGTRNEGLDGVIAGCLPPGRGPVLLSKLTRLWTISSTHLHDLCTAKELALVPGQTLKAKQTPLLVRASVTEFLKRRRIT